MSKKTRIILLPGFGEDKRIFRNIIPHLSEYQTLIVDYQQYLSDYSPRSIRLEKFVRKLILIYQITEKDILIGHSMGGYLAHHIRQRVGCAVCLHSSFVHPKKIKILVKNLPIVKWTVKNGLFQSELFKSVSNWKYKNKPSLQEIKHVRDLLGDMGAVNVLKLVLLFYKRKRRFMNWLRSEPDYQLAPNLIIHPERDNIVASPNEDHIAVSGDHFSIATHPLETVQLLKNWIAQELETSKTYHIQPLSVGLKKAV